MTRRHFVTAAEIVNNIRQGFWTNELPPYAVDPDENNALLNDLAAPLAYVRSVHTAEAFICFFRSYNPRFDEPRFLIACGLVEAPPKKGRTRATNYTKG